MIVTIIVVLIRSLSLAWVVGWVAAIPEMAQESGACRVFSILLSSVPVWGLGHTRQVHRAAVI